MLGIASRRLSVVAAAATLALCLLGAPRPAEAAYGRVTLNVDGVKRTATLVEFERLKKRKRPVIIVLGLDAFARNIGAVIVYPDAVDGFWGRSKPGQPPPNDEAFVRALATKLVDQGVASRRRIFVAGISGGGMLAMKLGCDSADLFSGVGAFVANMPTDWAASCKPSQPVAFMLMNGTADPMAPFNGGVANMPEGPRDVLSAEATVAIFSKAAQCSGQRNQTILDRDKNDGSRVVIEHGVGCKAPVELVKVEGGGHTIPGRRLTSTRGAPIGAQNNDLDGARLMWDFLLKRAPQ
jgi:polyhydroxybutyrate depolymerase